MCQLFVNFDNFSKFENSDKRWQTCQHRDILHIVRHQLYNDDNNDDSNDDNNDDIKDDQVQLRCVPGTARCSGKADCTDASDEFEYVKDGDNNDDDDDDDDDLWQCWRCKESENGE